jgi:hypothetical protein
MTSIRPRTIEPLELRELGDRLANGEDVDWEPELKVKDLTTFTPCATRSNRIRTGPARSPVATRAGIRTPGPA